MEENIVEVCNGCAGRHLVRHSRGALSDAHGRLHCLYRMAGSSVVALSAIHHPGESNRTSRTTRYRVEVADYRSILMLL